MRILKLVFWIIIVLIAIVTLFFAIKGANAATNTTSTSPNYYAWGDGLGWIDFFNTNTVITDSTHIVGYASSSAGYVSLDCATSPSGNICGTSNYGICQSLVATHQTNGSCTGLDVGQLGQLSGYAWNDVIGWISFCGQTTGNAGCVTSTYPYGVTINTGTGDLSGYAWNDLVGWINFNCNSGGSSCPPDYKVSVSWTATSTAAYLYSSIIDTQTTPGSTLNSIQWQGAQSALGLSSSTFVDFQIAVSNSTSGPWNYVGPSGDNTTYFSATCDSGFKGGISVTTNATMGKPICIDPAQVANYRYLRYLVRLRSDLLQTDTPRVDDVILNWSP